MKTILDLMRGRFWYAPYVVIVLLIGVVLLRSHQLEDTRADLKVEQDFRVEVGGILKAPANDMITVRAAARAVVKSNDERKTTLETIDRDTKAAKKRADAADAELKRVQAQNARDFAAAQPVIRELENRKPTGNPVVDQQQLEDDSMAPWKGWK